MAGSGPSDAQRHDPDRIDQPAGHHHGGHHRHSRGGASDLDHARLLRLITIAISVVVVIGAIVLWPSSRSIPADAAGIADDPLDAHVTNVTETPCQGDATSVCMRIEFRLTDGPQAGTTGSFEHGESSDVDTGDDIQVTAFTGQSGETIYSFYEFQRRTPMLILGLLFVAAVVALGRWRGVGAIAGLAASLIAIVWFALPSLRDGNNAVAVALVTSGFVAIVALYLAHGVSPATDVALVSTFISLALTGLLAWIFIGAAKFTGLSEDANFVVAILGSEVDPRGLLLAGIIIGSLGVLDDVTVTQVSAVWELHHSRPDQTRHQLFTRALVIGRDHISSTVNTLFLAYAGATLPLLLLFSGIGAPVGAVATREIVAIEIVRALVGSIGLVASVPVSTWLAAVVVRGRSGPRRNRPPARAWWDLLTRRT
jgi:uncharacterized membrane protein